MTQPVARPYYGLLHNLIALLMIKIKRQITQVVFFFKLSNIPEFAKKKKERDTNSYSFMYHNQKYVISIPSELVRLFIKYILFSVVVVVFCKPHIQIAQLRMFLMV